MLKPPSRMHSVRLSDEEYEEMKMLKRRSRMLSVRLSEEEYEELMRFCILTGARSVSDITRDAMRGLLNGGNGNGSGGVRAEDLHAQMQVLNQKFEDLAERIGATQLEAKR